MSAASMLPPSALARRSLTFREQYWRDALGSEREPLETTFVADRGESIVGFATLAVGWNPENGDIKHVYVHPEHLRQRVGSELLREACRGLIGLGYKTAEIWVFEGNDWARRFYESHGCTRTGGRREVDIWETDERLSVVEYQKDLGPSNETAARKAT